MEIVRRQVSLPPVQLSLRDFCRQRWPEDSLDMKGRVSPENLTGPEKDALRDRLHAAITATFRIASWIVQPAVDETGAAVEDDHPMQEYLDRLGDWLNSDRKKDAKKLANAALLESGLMTVIPTTNNVGQRVGKISYSTRGDNRLKAVVSAFRAWGSDFASEAGCHALDAGLSAAREYEQTEKVPGGTAHEFVKGVMAGSV